MDELHDPVDKLVKGGKLVEEVGYENKMSFPSLFKGWVGWKKSTLHISRFERDTFIAEKSFNGHI